VVARPQTRHGDRTDVAQRAVAMGRSQHRPIGHRVEPAVHPVGEPGGLVPVLGGAGPAVVKEDVPVPAHPPPPPRPCAPPPPTPAPRRPQDSPSPLVANQVVRRSSAPATPNGCRHPHTRPGSPASTTGSLNALTSSPGSTICRRPPANSRGAAASTA